MRLPSPGEYFERKYLIQEALGEGGFATVFRATDIEIERDVAIKILAPQDGEYAAGIAARFLVEARVIAGLRGSARFDSLAVLASGNIAVATLVTGCITELSPAGEIVRTVATPDIYPTNICFGGADRCTAYITLSDSGRLATMRWPEPGLELNFG